jgi:rod shape-determining protein MreD
VSIYVGATLVVFAALVEASVLPLFRVDGLQPNLTLVLLMTWLIIRGPEEAYVLIPIGGVFIGLVDGALMGTALLAMAPVAVLQEIRGAQLNEKGLLMAVVFTLIMSLVYHYTHLFVFTLQGEAGSWMEATRQVILPTTLMNLAVLLPLYAAFAFLNPQPRRSLYA